MYTLKIHWWRYVTDEAGVGGIADETTLFLPADEVRVHGDIIDLSEMNKWAEHDYANYLALSDTPDVESPGRYIPGRLIERRRNGENTDWYIASKAWLLGPDGKTIERLT